MAEFFEMSVQREDGSVALHYVNIEAISYLEYQAASGERPQDTLKVHLHDGYWFTLFGANAQQVLSLVRARGGIQLKERTSEN